MNCMGGSSRIKLYGRGSSMMDSKWATCCSAVSMRAKQSEDKRCRRDLAREFEKDENSHRCAWPGVPPPPGVDQKEEHVEGDEDSERPPRRYAPLLDTAEWT